MGNPLSEAAPATSLPVERALGSGVHLLKHPYPYRATLALSNDCDGMRLETFEALHRYLNTREETQWGEGLGLDVADSFWVYSPEQRGVSSDQRIVSMRNGCELTSENDLGEILAMYVHAGWIDTLHSIGSFPRTAPRPTRAHAEAAVDLFSRYGIQTPVWVDHGGTSNVQNLGRWDWALGAQPGSECFLADLLGDLGVRFVSDERINTATDPRMSERIELENLSGQELWWFARWRARRVAQMDNTEGVTQLVSHGDDDDTAKLWHPTALHHQLNPEVLDQVVREGLSLIVAQHLGWMIGPEGHRFRLDEYPPAALEAFRLLRRYQDDGSVLVTRTSRLLGFLRAKQSLRVRVEETTEGVAVDCLAFDEGSRVERPTVDSLRGLSFFREGSEPTRILIEGRPLPEHDVETARLENGAGSVAAISWYSPDVRDHAESRHALGGAAKTKPQLERNEIPTIAIQIDPQQLEQASDRARSALVHTIQRQERAAFFGRESAPEKEWAYLDLNSFPSFEDYLAACKKVQRGAALRQARKASDRGYRGRFFNPRTHVVDMVEIDTSAPVRQGQLLGSHYFRTVEERGGYPDAVQPEVVPAEPLVWNRYFGLFAEEAGHRQGEVVVGERLLAYITLRRAAELAFYGTILGHAEHLREGIMYRLQLDLVEHLLAQRELLASGTDGADASLRGLRYLLYSRFFDTEGLSQWKKKMLFQPGYFVCDYSVVGGVTEPSSAGPSSAEAGSAEAEPARPYVTPRASWSDAVLGLDETGTKLRLSDGELDIPGPPAPGGAPVVELELDRQMQQFLSKLLIFTPLKSKLTVSSATAVEPPVHLRGLGRIPIRIGAFSYSYSPIRWISELGRYCSLADGIEVAFVEHPTDWLSTSSFTYDTDPKGFMWRQFAEGEAGQPSGEAFVPRAKPGRERRVVLGNDVWIGSGAYIKGGVTVGDSAIVGARAVVTKDVPPFAIAAGNPARVVRMRLPEEQIERLRRLEWWRFPYTELGGIELEDAERAVDALEERITSGRIRPYTPAWISFGWIAETAERLRSG